MSEFYTDDEFRSAFKALGCTPRMVQRLGDPQPVQECSRHKDVWPCSTGLGAAEAVLDAVAPAIAARAKREALREYADDLESNESAATWEWSDFVDDAREYADSYRAERN